MRMTTHLTGWEVEALAEIKAHALENYERGWDVIVEAFTDDEIAHDFIIMAADKVEAMHLARAFVEVRHDYAEDIRAAGR